MIMYLAVFAFGFPLIYFLINTQKDKNKDSDRLKQIQRRLKEIENADASKDIDLKD